MSRLPTGLLLSIALVAMVLPLGEPAQAATAPAVVKFGMDANSVAAQKAAGVAPDYGTFWIGPWTLSSGWAGPDGQLTNMRNAGVAPAIHFYYWGDDISPSCVENGCWSDLHNAQKTRAGWELLGKQLTDHLNAKMGGAPVVIFLESEFNKGGIETYEPFDGYMADMAAKIHANYPSAIIVLGFGNWGSVYWGNFDRAAAESDMVGIQGLRGSTRQSKDGMMTLYDGLLAGVKTLEAKFPGEAIMLTDIAVSSYPEPDYLPVQAAVLREVFDNLGTLKAHGVQAMIYRSWRDSPNMDPANYYGYAEQHWGLAWQGNGTLKESGRVWVAGVQGERSGLPSTGSSTTTTTSGAYTATVTPASGSNEWWIQVSVSPAPAKVETKVGSGSYVLMDKQSYGWTKSLHAPAGTPVQFRVTSLDGQVAATAPQAWLIDMSAKTATSTTTSTSSSSSAVTGTSSPVVTSTSSSTVPTSTTSAPFTAKVTPSGNEWWVQANVASASAPVAKVEAKAGTGSWTALTKESYGWAKSFNVPTGTSVQFRLTASDGATATTPGQAWLVDMTAKTATSSSTTTTSATTSPTATTSASTTSTSVNTTTTSASASSTSATMTTTSSSTTSTSVNTTTTSSSASSTSATMTTTSASQTSTTEPSTTTAAPTPSPSPSATTTSSASPSTSIDPAPTSSSSSTPAPALAATFTPLSAGNAWWVEVAVNATQPLAKVEARANNGPYVALTETADGTYAASMHASRGAKVTFRATSTAGESVISAPFSWR